MEDITNKITEENVAACIKWIQDWFENDSGGARGVVVGISGGKDCAVVAALCVRALGKDNVFGVLMPNGEQSDFNDAVLICDHLDIHRVTFNIKPMYDAFTLQLALFQGTKMPDEVLVNILPRLRMTVLYAFGQDMHYRVAGTGNLSERTVGYFTKWGDGACDFNPIGKFTKEQVVQIGEYLGLPDKIVHKPPSDGLWGDTDEDRLGVTYEDINKYLRGDAPFDNPQKDNEMSSDVFSKIFRLQTISSHKRKPIPMFTKVNY